MDKPCQAELARIYDRRFAATQEYRRCVWRVLVTHFFQKLVPATGSVLDLGCGYGEFINAVRAREKFAMDLNPNSRQQLSPEVTFYEQDCSQRWPLADSCLDVVFTSNFFEHLPEKNMLSRTLHQAWRCLKVGGCLIALGPNIRLTSGRYWDYWDHHLPLTEASLCEGLSIHGFRIEQCLARFLPYTMVRQRQYPLWLVTLYLRLPLVWRLLGKQFLVVAKKP